MQIKQVHVIFVFYLYFYASLPQGPVGYVAASENGSQQMQCVPDEPACYPGQGPSHPPPSFHAAGLPPSGGYSTLHHDYVRQRDHLSFLRSRQAVEPNRGHVQPFFPTYLDQCGRPWPALYPTVAGAGNQPGVFTRPPAGDPDVMSEMSYPDDGRRPVYRSRSDETLSTVSSFRQHRSRRPDKKSHRKSGAKMQQHQCRAVIETQSRAVDQVAAADNSTDSVANSAGVLLPSSRNDNGGLESKATYVDSSSNPDSGYSGASHIAPPLPLPRLPPAPRSESSSLRSESSGDAMTGGKAPTLGSSCRSDSVPSLCNSL